MSTPRAHFVEHLHELEHGIQQLAEAVDARVGDALWALRERDAELARSVIEADREVNAKQLQIEVDCITLIAEQAPVAGDLRLAVSVLFTASELERVGDYAVAIARIAEQAPDDGPLPLLEELLAMSTRARPMLHRAVAALLERDEASARKVGLADEAIDQAQERIYWEMLQRISDEAHTFEARMHVLWVAHHLERLADRATNIAERAIYVATGEIAELN
jgi:phosphate transport system protein